MEKNDKKNLFYLVLILGAVLLVAGFAYAVLGKKFSGGQLAVQPTAAPNTASGESTGEPDKLAALDFTVYDEDGNAVKLSDFIGKPVVLNFWASWCGPCQSEMPDFDRANQELDGAVQFMMVNVTDGQRETVETASKFIEKNGYTLPVFFDKFMEASNTYGAYALPTTYFIDAEGYLVARAQGAIDADLLKQGLEMIYTPESAEAE